MRSAEDTYTGKELNRIYTMTSERWIEEYDSLRKDYITIEEAYCNVLEQNKRDKERREKIHVMIFSALIILPALITTIQYIHQKISPPGYTEEYREGAYYGYDYGFTTGYEVGWQNGLDNDYYGSFDDCYEEILSDLMYELGDNE